MVVFQQNSPVVFKLSYQGGIQGWDAYMSVADTGHINLTNHGILKVFNSEGVELTPRKLQAGELGLVDSIIESWMNLSMNFPFEVQVDLSKYFDLSEPGVYRLQWGSKNLELREIEFEIVQSKKPNNADAPNHSPEAGSR